MQALFDQDCEFVGWMDHGTYIYDDEMNWVAFIFNRHAWSAQTGNWLGPVYGTTCLDRHGRVVAWHSKDYLYGGMIPIKPPKPLRPPRPSAPAKQPVPHKPAAPIPPPTGWSELGWSGWLAQ